MMIYYLSINVHDSITYLVIVIVNDRFTYWLSHIIVIISVAGELCKLARVTGPESPPPLLSSWTLPARDWSVPRGGIKAFLGRTAQDVHLDSHTAPELCTSFRCAKKPLYHIFLFPEGVCPVNYRGVLARLFCQNIHVGMSCCCLFPYVSDLKMFFCRRVFACYRSWGFSDLNQASPGTTGLEPQREPPAHHLVWVY